MFIFCADECKNSAIIVKYYILALTCEFAFGDCLVDSDDCATGNIRPDLPCDSGTCCQCKYIFDRPEALRMLQIDRTC